MEYVANWLATMQADVVQVFEQVVAYLPKLISGILLILVGWIVARALRAIASHLVSGWDWLHRLTIGRTVDREKVRETSASMVGIGVYWLTLLFFVTAAAQTLDLEAFSHWLSRAILYLPQLISGAIVMVLGVALGNLALNTITRGLKSVREQQRALLGRAAQAIVVVTMFVIGLDLIGVDTSVVVTIIGVALGMFFGGGALAFGLGARTMVGNLIGARCAQRDCRVGDIIRIGNAEGRILQLNRSTVVLETSEGRATLPGKLFSEEGTLVLEGDRGRG